MIMKNDEHHLWAVDTFIVNELPIETICKAVSEIAKAELSFMTIYGAESNHSPLIPLSLAQLLVLQSKNET